MSRPRSQYLRSIPAPRPQPPPTMMLEAPRDHARDAAFFFGGAIVGMLALVLVWRIFG